MPDRKLNESLFISRQENLLSRAASCGLDGALVFGFGSALGAGSKSHGALRYLTGWDSHEAVSLFVISAQVRLLIVSSPFMVPLGQSQFTTTAVIHAPPDQWAGILTARLGVKPQVGTVGFNEMPIGMYRSISPAVIAPDCVELDDHLSHMRLRKDDVEIALHRKGAEICDALFGALAPEIRKGKPVWQAQLALETQARGLGADYCKTWLTVRPCADYPRYWPNEGRNTPQTGDQVLFGIALTVQGHWAHGIRMGSMGPAQSSHQSLWQLTHDMMQAGSECLRVGDHLRSCELTMEQILTGHRDKYLPNQMSRFRNGHGLGHSYEDPVLTDYFPQHFGAVWPSAGETPALMLQPSMLFELHPNIFLANVGGAALGEMFLTHDTGPERLLKFPIGMFEI